MSLQIELCSREPIYLFNYIQHFIAHNNHTSFGVVPRERGPLFSSSAAR
jgi:hypothetical protein